MAINFETVTGNQSSANVLAQINNNFAKVNSNPVPKAEFATNADTVDNKHASELIPGAATFLNSISTLANLSVGRYFCTQTRQSWEPVTTTGSRTFLIEVSLNTSNNLKNYKINYIAGAGAGESYYSDYSSGSIRWNRIVNNKNIDSFDSVKYTLNQENKKGIVVTKDSYIYLDTVPNNNFSPNSNMIRVPESNGEWKYYYSPNISITIKSISTDRCSGFSSSQVDLVITVYLKQLSDGTIIKTYTKTLSNITSKLNYTVGTFISGSIDQYKVNMNTKDLMFTISSINDLFYLSSDESNSSILHMPNIGSSIITSMQFWHNNVFGYLSYYSSREYIYCDAYKLNSTRTAYDTNISQNIDNGPGFTKIGQKNGFYYYKSGTRVVYIDIANISILAKTFPVSGYSASYALMDNNNIYCLCNNGANRIIFKYDLLLNLVGQTSVFSGGDYLTLTDNYVITNTKIFNKTDLSLKSTGASVTTDFTLEKESITGYYCGDIDSFGPDINGVNIYAPKIQGDYYISKQITQVYLFGVSMPCAEITNADTGKTVYITNASASAVKVKDFFGTRDVYINGNKTNFKNFNPLFLYFKVVENL